LCSFCVCLPYSNTCKSNRYLAANVVAVEGRLTTERALRHGDFETLARVHNAGPGYRNAMNETGRYWWRVRWGGAG
jgi:hypothetical protein